MACHEVIDWIIYPTRVTPSMEGCASVDIWNRDPGDGLRQDFIVGEQSYKLLRKIWLKKNYDEEM